MPRRSVMACAFSQTFTAYLLDGWNEFHAALHTVEHELLELLRLNTHHLGDRLYSLAHLIALVHEILVDRLHRLLEFAQQLFAHVYATSEEIHRFVFASTGITLLL